MEEQCKDCKFKGETEEGKEYCTLNECYFSDFPDAPHQFDNLTGSMNL